jgi:hypothetical protein
MADYVPFNTKRLKVLQTGPRGTHHLIFRFPQVQSEATMLSQARAVCSSFNGLLLDGTSFESAEVANEGSEVFVPVGWGAPIVTATGAGVTANDEYGRYVNFVGRSTGGSRVAYYLFNVTRATGTANNRLTAAENANITTILNAFTTDAVNLIAIDQNPFFLKSYANTGINDAVAKKSRSLA